MGNSGSLFPSFPLLPSCLILPQLANCHHNKWPVLLLIQANWCPFCCQGPGALAVAGSVIAIISFRVL